MQWRPGPYKGQLVIDQGGLGVGTVGNVWPVGTSTRYTVDGEWPGAEFVVRVWSLGKYAAYVQVLVGGNEV